MNENKFEFNYSAPSEQQRRTIESIKSQYEAKSDVNEAYERIMSLDKRVKNVPTIVSLVLGVVGLLVFGLGFTMVLQWGLYLWGILVAIVGCVPMALAPILYKAITSKMKEKYGPEILRLSEMMLNK